MNNIFFDEVSGFGTIARKIRTFLSILRSRFLIFFLNLGGRATPSILVALLWKLSFYRVKGVHCNKRSRPKILVLDKSIGTNDVVASYSTPADYDVQFMSRSMVKILAKHFLRGSVGDHDYRNDDPVVHRLKEEYRNKLKKVLYWLKIFFDVRVLISFNPTYYAERELTSASKEVGIRFVVLHKESNSNENIWRQSVQIIQSEIRKFDGDLIIPYNNYVRDAYLTSGIVDSDRVIVSGCPRLDFAHSLRGTLSSKEKKSVVYYMTNPLAGLGLLGKKGGRFHSMKISDAYEGIWMENILQLNAAFAELVIENPDVNFIIKGKIGFFRDQQVLAEKEIDLEQMKNLKCVSGGSGEKLLKSASAVIGFNSVTVYEAIAAGIPVITPRFKMKRNDFYDEFASDVCGATLCPTSAVEFKAAVIECHTERGFYQELSDRQIEVLENYMGNSDGMSGARVKKILDSLMN